MMGFGSGLDLRLRVDKTAITNPDGARPVMAWSFGTGDGNYLDSSISDNISVAMCITASTNPTAAFKTGCGRRTDQLLYTSVTLVSRIPGSGAKLRPSATHRVPVIDCGHRSHDRQERQPSFRHRIRLGQLHASGPRRKCRQRVTQFTYHASVPMPSRTPTAPMILEPAFLSRRHCGVRRLDAYGERKYSDGSGNKSRVTSCLRRSVPCRKCDSPNCIGTA